jgi:NAD+ kinase
MNIGIAINPKRVDAYKIIQKLQEEFPNENLFLEEETAKLLNLKGLAKNKEALKKESDIFFALGGDGTLLYAARLVGGKVSILSINLGSSLGFLTTITWNELTKYKEDILNHNFRVEERMMTKIEVITKSSFEKIYHSLNEAVLIKDIKAKLMRIKISVGISSNTQPLIELNADGVIIATPTGSTGYSLSAGGPIVSPYTKAIILTPICPHSLSARPIIFSENETLKVETISEDSLLFIDGQEAQKLKPYDYIIISKACECIKLIRLKGTKNFYEMLRTKLKL